MRSKRSWDTAPAGQHDLYIYADPSYSLTETTRANNLASMSGCFSIVEDLDCSGRVDVTDVQAVASAWNSAELQFDLDGDGDVDIIDVQRVAARWGEP